MSEDKKPKHKKFALSKAQKSAMTHAIAVIVSLLAAGFGMPMLMDLDVMLPAIEDSGAEDSGAEDSDAKPEAHPAAPADTDAPAPPAEEKAP